MQMGWEVELKGKLYEGEIKRMLNYVVDLWPELGQTLHLRIFGLKWDGECKVEKMLRYSRNRENISGWRNKSIDPFQEPPFQLLWIQNDNEHVLAFRAHHSVVDGEAFFDICTEAVRILANLKKGVKPSLPLVRPSANFIRLIDALGLVRKGKIIPMIRYLRRTANDAKLGLTARFAMNKCEPGNISLCERLIDGQTLLHLRQYAGFFYTTHVWLCAAAWIKTIYKWNLLKNKSSCSRVSLEIPVNFRRKYNSCQCMGNFISPLITTVDALPAITDVARALQKQFRNGARDLVYFGLPLFTFPAQFIPWKLFRRFAATSSSTGSATSHFTWLKLKQSRDVYMETSKASGGELQIIDQRVFSPVCLHMGASLLILGTARPVKAIITYRLNAFSDSGANTLADLFARELMECVEENKAKTKTL